LELKTIESRIAAAEARCGPKQTIYDEGTAPVLQMPMKIHTKKSIAPIPAHRLLVPRHCKSATSGEPQCLMTQLLANFGGNTRPSLG
jgi:hypothetical protein